MKYNYNYKNEAGEYAPKVLTLEDGRQVINPTEAMYAEAGYLPWTPPQASESEIEEQERMASIESLKMQLAETDYKVIKVAECAAVGEAAPYDVAELHRERQALRDQINALEQMSNEEYSAAHHEGNVIKDEPTEENDGLLPEDYDYDA